MFVVFVVFIGPHLHADFRLERSDIAVIVLVCGQRVLLNPQQSFPCNQHLEQIDFAELEGATEQREVAFECRKDLGSVCGDPIRVGIDRDGGPSESG